MRWHTKVAPAVVVALILGITGCSVAEPAPGSSPSSENVVEDIIVPASGRVVLPTPAPPAPAHDFVAPAAPTWFEISGPAFDIKASVCQMNFVLPLDPPGDQKHTVCWVRKDFGVAPGSDSHGTSYILGHSWAVTPLIFNPLSELVMRDVNEQDTEMQNGVPTYPVNAINGYKITLRTPNGTLTYKVTAAFAVPKPQAGNVRSLMANTPNRVVLITCGVKDGVDVDDNVVVYAYLTSSTAV